MKKALMLLLVVAVAVVVYVLVKSDGGVKVALAEQNASGESGTALLAEVDGTVVVTLTISGQPADVAQPAHIHKGSCPNPGEVLHPLDFPEDGGSLTTLDTTFEALKAAGPLAINVHKSADEASVYVACGDIVF